MDRQHVDAERCFQGREFEELVDDHLRAGVAFQLDFDAGFLVGKVAHAGDAGEGFFVHQLGDALLEGGTVDAVGDLADDDERFAVFVFFDLDLAAESHRAAAGGKVAFDATDAADFGRNRKVRALDVLHQLGQRDLRLIDLRADAIDHLAEVVGREVGGHADSDAGAAVDEEVGKCRGQHRGLLLRAVVVGLEVDRVFIEVVHHRHAEMVEAGLGVSHGGGSITFHRSKVSLTIDEHLAHRPWLAHVDECRVD